LKESQNDKSELKREVMNEYNNNWEGWKSRMNAKKKRRHRDESNGNEEHKT
jgi:hypothetical protein